MVTSARPLRAARPPAALACSQRFFVLPSSALTQNLVVVPQCCCLAVALLLPCSPHEHWPQMSDNPPSPPTSSSAASFPTAPASPVLVPEADPHPNRPDTAPLCLYALTLLPKTLLLLLLIMLLLLRGAAPGGGRSEMCTCEWTTCRRPARSLRKPCERL